MGRSGENTNSSVPTRNIVNQATANLAGGTIGMMLIGIASSAGIRSTVGKRK